MCKLTTIFLLNLFLGFSFACFAAPVISLPEGAISSPYEACQNVIIVSKNQYEENKSKWNKFEKDCKTKVQVATDAGITSLDPLKEGVEYLEFAQRVAKKVFDNLEKSKLYAECSKLCFQGAMICSKNDSGENKIVKCLERKDEVIKGLKVNSVKLRLLLALSDDAPGIVDVNIQNILTLNKEKLINSSLSDFEIGTPNPLGKNDLSKREFDAAISRNETRRKQLEEEFKESRISKKLYGAWMSKKLMENFEDNRVKYRNLMYKEAPIFGVIERPTSYEAGHPVWTNTQIANAFQKLADNATNTQAKVTWSMNKSKIEFTRYNGEAVGNWLASLAPGVKDKNDLLFYFGMKNQVEEVLKEDTSSCAIATSMEMRLKNKQFQNSALTLVAAVGGGVGLKGASNIFRIGRALSGSEAAGITGLALGATFLGDSFRKYNSTKEEALTLSGLGGAKEGTSLRKGEDVDMARDGVKLSVVLAPLDVLGGWGVGKVLYSSLAKQMTKELPEIATLMKKAKTDLVARDLAVDKWLSMKIKSALKSGNITKSEQGALLNNKGTASILETLTAEIEKSNPKFFNNPKNVDFFLKTAATMAKKEIRDPSNLGEQAKNLLLNFNTEAMNGSWNPQAQAGLLKVFNNAIDELRVLSIKDPATYAKFSTDPSSREKVMLTALRKSGASDDEIKAMSHCALRR